MRPFLIALGLLAVACLRVQAQNGDWGRETILTVNNGVRIGYASLHLDYREPSNGRIQDKYFDTERGTLSEGGIGVSFSAMRTLGPVRELYLEGSFRRVTGSVAYDGHAYVGPTSTVVPIRLTSYARIDDWSMRLGRGFSLANGWLFTPYLGYAYHFWRRTIGKGSFAELQEDYSHHAIQLGNRLQWAPWRRLVLTVEGRFGLTLGPRIRVPSYRFDQRLGRAAAADLEAEADTALARFLHAFAGLQYSHFSYGQSRVQNGVLEPFSVTDAVTWQAGARLTFR